MEIRINKTNYFVRIWVVFSLVMFYGISSVFAQSNLFNKYGLFVTKDINILQKEIAADGNKKMMDLRKMIPALIFDLRYATKDNFTHQKLYPRLTTSYLRKPAAEALKEVVEELKQSNLTIKIFDAYRPYSVTEVMWEMVKDDRYAADPAKGSGHNRGTAVDVTLVDLSTKRELPMGTGFDNFTDTAHQDFKDLSPEILKNRQTLKHIMEKYGFIALETEWWHFYLPKSSEFELLDISFSDLKKPQNDHSRKRGR